MHCNEGRACGLALLRQLGRLVVRRKEGQTEQIITQPLLDVCPVEAALDRHVDLLWNEQIPICIEVLLVPSCECPRSREDSYGLPSQRVLLERWTMRTVTSRDHGSPPTISPHWLLNAVRSQLHFSQLSAWRATIQNEEQPERRRKLSRETCNYKKVEANCDTEDTETNKLNVVYSIKTVDQKTDFSRPPTDHHFPVTDLQDNVYLKVHLQSLPRLEEIPILKCACRIDHSHEDLIGKLNDLTLGRKEYKKILDDRMLTPCSESGKHKCSCDDESDEKKGSERKEIAKYKRRLRKECKLKKLCDSTSSDGERKEPYTSIPILQASRFDRFRAIGCYRNQTYLTLPASRIETKSPFTETAYNPPEYKKTNTVATQTDDLICICGNSIQIQCDTCSNRLVRSEGSYNLAENGARRKINDDGRNLKKLKCDINSNNSDSLGDKCDVVKRPKLRRFFPIVDRIERVISDRFAQKTDMEELNLRHDDSVFSVKPDAKRQKTYSINEDFVEVEKCDYGTIDKVTCPDKAAIPDTPPEADRLKWRECNGTIERVCDRANGSPGESSKCNIERTCPDRSDIPVKPKVPDIPSPGEMERFKWRFDSAASMVFHTKTGLPLTSSPAPLRKGNSCFDFDSSIKGVSGIKSALFHPISPPSPDSPQPPSPSPCPLEPTLKAEARDSTRDSPTPTPKKKVASKLKIGSSTGLLGTFEESALQGRLEAAATVHGFTAELGASGAFCPPHRRLPVTVFFYAPGGTSAPYMGHINLGPGGYRVSRAGTVQVSLFNPHGTLVKMFVVLYDLTGMPPRARTFLRQRTLHLPAGADPPVDSLHACTRYLIHLRFMTSKSGKLYLHTDIRILVSRKADLDTATALSRPLTNHSASNDAASTSTNHSPERDVTPSSSNHSSARDITPSSSTNHSSARDAPTNQRPDRPNRVFGGCGEFDFGYENQNGVAYELRSFTYAPDNPKYSPR